MILFLFSFYSFANIGIGISNVGTISSVTGIEGENITPAEYCLNQNYPNPFNPSTQIKFTLPKSSNVKIEVFNSLGQKIRVVLNQKINAGANTIKFNADNLPSGIYYYRIKSDSFISVKKMLLVR
jgi:hypothetical protein